MCAAVDTVVSAPPDEDAALVERSRAGDLRAFEALVDRYRAVVVRIARRITGPADAEDVAQETFLRAFHRLGQYRGESPFRSWLLRIAHNTALDTLARQRPSAADVESEEVGDLPHPHKTPAEQLEDDELRERLLLKLREVQPTHRAVLVLRDLEGLSYEEIAQVTDAPLGSVKGRLFRARRELIEALRHNTYDWELPGE
ncbi:MAG: sigma-70 family RNA polymerase sigma factor [Actinomycetota bacterium]|nr:sigma-70 family RNA polymerase sigma factor [Actinomycetota bacterium]